jgi:phosphate transport system protein
MEVIERPLRPSLEDALHRIRDAVLDMGEMVDDAISYSSQALAERDVAVATQVVQADALVNAKHASVHAECLSVILTQAPVARDLRQILGFLHMSDELERMADHCVSVARVARDLSDLPPLRAPIDLTDLARMCATQVRDVLNAMVARDTDRAREVALRDDRVDILYRRIVDGLLDAMRADSRDVYPGTRLISVAMYLERIADRVTNLAEDLVFLETGNVEELG